MKNNFDHSIFCFKCADVLFDPYYLQTFIVVLRIMSYHGRGKRFYGHNYGGRGGGGRGGSGRGGGRRYFDDDKSTSDGGKCNFSLSLSQFYNLFCNEKI